MKPSSGISVLSKSVTAGGLTTPAQGWYRGDLHFHSNYSDDALDQGGDWIGAALRIAEYYDDALFVQAFPEYEGNGLDFIALTDHRTIIGCSDPEFESDRLILICGEEFGNTGHAGSLNITETISSDPTDGRSPNEQIQWAIDRTREIGGVFSANHPAGDDDMWFWDVDGYEGAEVWNTFWTLIAPPTPESVLDEHVANYGVENRFIRRALRQEGQGMSGQYLAFYEAHLVGGVPLAAVGGGDRHMLVMPGHPTTYIQADEASPDGLMDGLRDRHTFVSRSPAGPQVLLSATRGAESFSMGDVLAPNGTSLTLTARVARAHGGVLRIRVGSVYPDITRDELLAMESLGETLYEIPIEGDSFEWKGSWNPGDGGWVYAQVLESTDNSQLSPDVQQDLEMLTRAMQSYGQRYGLLARSLLPLIDVETLLMPDDCSPNNWDIQRTVCVDADDNYLGTIHISEPFDRVLNIYRENDRLTDYAMGAISSALVVMD